MYGQSMLYETHLWDTWVGSRPPPLLPQHGVTSYLGGSPCSNGRNAASVCYVGIETKTKSYYGGYMHVTSALRIQQGVKVGSGRLHLDVV